MPKQGVGVGCKCGADTRPGPLSGGVGLSNYDEDDVGGKSTPG